MGSRLGATQVCSSRLALPAAHNTQVFVMEQRGEAGRLRDGEGAKLAWMLDSPLRFCARFGISPEEFDALLLEHGWQRSKRAQRYQLADRRLEGA
jgi:hypothetical protein